MRSEPSLTPGQTITLHLSTARYIGEKLSATQRRELARAATDKFGIVTLGDSRRGLRRAGWERMMNRLSEIGVCKPYVHGGYEITALGRAALTFK